MGYMVGAIEYGLVYALMALGVFITFRILNFPDLTVDGSFTTGAAVATVMTVSGVPPWLAVLGAFGAGGLAGICTGLLHTKGKINGLLSGIIMMIALYSINLRILSGKPMVSLRDSENLFTQSNVLVVMVIVVVIIKAMIDLFFKTNVGLSLRATGDNATMIRSFGANTDNTIILGVSLSNALVGASGAFVAFYLKYVDNGMGVGMIVIGLASVIIGEAIFGNKSIFRATLAAIFGSVIYRIITGLAIYVDWLEASDMKLITAVVVIIALIIPYMYNSSKQKKIAKQRTSELLAIHNEQTGGGR